MEVEFTDAEVAEVRIPNVFFTCRSQADRLAAEGFARLHRAAFEVELAHRVRPTTLKALGVLELGERLAEGAVTHVISTGRNVES